VGQKDKAALKNYKGFLHKRKMHGLTQIDVKLMEFESHCNKILEMKLIDDIAKQLTLKDAVDKAYGLKAAKGGKTDDQPPATSPNFKIGRRTVSMGGTLH